MGCGLATCRWPIAPLWVGGGRQHEAGVSGPCQCAYAASHKAPTLGAILHRARALPNTRRLRARRMSLCFQRSQSKALSCWGSPAVDRLAPFVNAVSASRPRVCCAAQCACTVMSVLGLRTSVRQKQIFRNQVCDADGSARSQRSRFAHSNIIRCFRT